MRYLTPDVLVDSRLGENPSPTWDTAVICFRDADGSQELVRLFNARPLGYKVLWGIDETHLFEAEVDGKQIGIVTECIWGGPQAAILVEELAHLGVSHVIGYGAAGGIDPDLREGDQVIVDSALVTDGTSRMYMPTCETITPDPVLCEIAERSAVGMSRVKKICCATVDALYQETHELVQGFRHQGAQIINLETSAFYAAAQSCGVGSLWIGYVSDLLVSNEWDDWYGDQDDMQRLTTEICLSVCRALSRRDEESAVSSYFVCEARRPNKRIQRTGVGGYFW